MILGVDPGLSGALAIYEPKTKELRHAFPIPTFLDAKGKKHINIALLSLFVEEHAKSIEKAIVEDVHAMPGQGVVSMFRFGQALGIVEGILGSFFLPVVKASPAVWKGIFKLSRDKKQSREMAATLFPDFSQQFAKPKSDGIAEAALLAVFGSYYG